MPDVKFEGEVTRFASALDPSTRTMKTEIDLPNSQGLLRPGMYGNVTLVLESHPAALTLPAATLVTEQGQHFVFVLKDNKAHKVKVTTGIDDAGSAKPWNVPCTCWIKPGSWSMGNGLWRTYELTICVVSWRNACFSTNTAPAFCCDDPSLTMVFAVG